MDTVAILPIKRFARAKQRLAPDLSDAVREELAEAMAADVLETLARVSGLDAVVVVTCDERARALAQAAGTQLVDDPAEAQRLEELGVDDLITNRPAELRTRGRPPR